MNPSHLFLALAASAVTASGQQVVFQDGFEAGIANWTSSGLMHLENANATCGALVAPFPEGTQAAYYGSPGTCSYNTGALPNAGGISLNNWIALPDAPSISLHFWMSSESEYCLSPTPGPPPEEYDIHFVTVQVEQPPATVEVRLCPSDGPGWFLLPWHERRIDLSAYRGLRVRIGIGFDSVDELFNSGLGWFVDDVRIVAEPGEHVCPTSGFGSMCPCQPAYVPVAGGCRNSTAQSAVMYSSGSVSVAADTLQFRANHMPPDTIALLSQSTAEGAWIPFGGGISCAGGEMRRLGIVQASNGVATWPTAGAPSISQRGQVPPAGGTRFYSVLYRDAVYFCAQPTFNVTETQRIQWVP